MLLFAQRGPFWPNWRLSGQDPVWISTKHVPLHFVKPLVEPTAAMHFSASLFDNDIRFRKKECKNRTYIGLKTKEARTEFKRVWAESLWNANETQKKKTQSVSLAEKDGAAGRFVTMTTQLIDQIGPQAAKNYAESCWAKTPQKDWVHWSAMPKE